MYIKYIFSFFIYQGVLRVVGDLDRDLYQLPNNSLTLMIEACDSGQPRLCSVREMTVRVTDVNDNSPVFSRPAYTARISETAQKDDAINVQGNIQVCGDIDHFNDITMLLKLARVSSQFMY